MINAVLTLIHLIIPNHHVEVGYTLYRQIGQQM